MAPGFQHLLRETQVAGQSRSSTTTHCFPGLGRRRQLRQQDLGEGRFTGFAVAMADHRHRQTRPQVQAHRRIPPQECPPANRQRLQQSLDMLHRLAARSPKTS